MRRVMAAELGVQGPPEAEPLDDDVLDLDAGAAAAENSALRRLRIAVIKEWPHRAGRPN